jgi:hypothetical protein
MDGRAACREAAEMVEIVPGTPRRLCERHEAGIRRALTQPDVFRVSWGVYLSEEIADLRGRIGRLESDLRDLAAPTSQSPDDSDWDDQSEADDDDWDDPWWSMSEEERAAYWDSPAGKKQEELSRLEGRLGFLLDSAEYYHRREEPAVRVHVTTESRGRSGRR